MPPALLPPRMPWTLAPTSLKCRNGWGMRMSARLGCTIIGKQAGGFAGVQDRVLGRAAARDSRNGTIRAEAIGLQRPFLRNEHARSLGENRRWHLSGRLPINIAADPSATERVISAVSGWWD